MYVLLSAKVLCIGYHRSPVAIKNLEFAIADKGFQNGWLKPNIPHIRTGKTIAIVGSGPAGLSAAQQLNSAGHHVKVFERADRIGGLMMYGIPNMKLDKSIIDQRLEVMELEGIEFFINTDVGGSGPNSISMDELYSTNDIVLLTTGATKPRDLAIPNRDGPEFTLQWTFSEQILKACWIQIIMMETIYLLIIRK